MPAPSEWERVPGGDHDCADSRSREGGGEPAEQEIAEHEDGEEQPEREAASADQEEPVKVDKTIEEVDAADYDALLIPGGVGNPDQLRGNENIVAFVQEFLEAGKPVAAICHGPWVLVEAGAA